MGITRFNPHIWMKTPRLTPALWLVALPDRPLRWGLFSDNFRVALRHSSNLITVFHILDAWMSTPHIWGYGVPRLSVNFAAGGGCFPQVRGVFHSLLPLIHRKAGQVRLCCLFKYAHIWGIWVANDFETPRIMPLLQPPASKIPPWHGQTGRTFLPYPGSASTFPSSKTVLPLNTTLRTLPLAFQPSKGVQPQRVNCSAALIS